MTTTRRTSRRTERTRRTRRTSSRTERGQGGQRRTRSLYKGDSNAASQYASDGAKVNIS